jgi:UDP-N-acetyl-D-mannosaminuronate dehydrogenase
MAKKLVIMGQGYVGLPLAEAAATNGYQVSGYEVSTTICDILNAGRSHIGDLSDSDVQRMLGLGYVATTEPACIGEADVIVICVPTPLSEDEGPDLTYAQLRQHPLRSPSG